MLRPFSLFTSESEEKPTPLRKKKVNFSAQIHSTTARFFQNSIVAAWRFANHAAQKEANARGAEILVSWCVLRLPFATDRIAQRTRNGARMIGSISTTTTTTTLFS